MPISGAGLGRPVVWSAEEAVVGLCTCDAADAAG
jgi:hypothetical protein